MADLLAVLGDVIEEFTEIADELQMNTINLWGALLDDPELERLFCPLLYRQSRYLGLLAFLGPARGHHCHHGNFVPGTALYLTT